MSAKIGLAHQHAATVGEMGRSGTAGKKTAVAVPAREKSRAELDADARDKRIDENSTRVGLDDTVVFIPKWAPRPSYRSLGDWQDIAYYEVVLDRQETAWGELDRDKSEIEYVNPDALDLILQLLVSDAGVEGLRTALKIYEAGREAGRSDGYQEGYNDGESAASDDSY